MRPAHQRPRWRCLDPQCPQHEWQPIPGGDPLHVGRDLIDQHIRAAHDDRDDPHCTLEWTEEVEIDE